MLRIRPAIADDTRGIQSLIGAVYAEYGCTLQVEEDEPHLREPGVYFRTHGGEFWVVEDEEGSVDGACIKATVAVAVHDAPDEAAAELKSLYVHASLRRQGWGRRLTELAIDYARRANCRRMFLWSDTRFVEAHRLYRNMGFGPCGTRALHDSNNSVEFGFEMSLED